MEKIKPPIDVQQAQDFVLKALQKYKHKPLVLIDGDKWIKLAEGCGYQPR
ncbi:MAG: hypothetical protein J1G04_03340 [Clostridiales bacterium]|nr:hypothetical protein [Clostridiales bacterium]